MQNCINWIDATTSKPAISINDEWDRRHETSDTVLLWYNDGKRQNRGVLGRYMHSIDEWKIDGWNNPDQKSITHFAYINSPEK